MKIKSLDRNFSSAASITAADISAIKAAGIRSIICNRPNGEADDQTNFDEISTAADTVGIKAAYVPLEKGKVPKTEVEAFAKALDGLPGPTLGYCATGTRSAALWALINSELLGKDQVISITRSAGFDIAKVVPSMTTDVAQQA